MSERIVRIIIGLYVLFGLFWMGLVLVLNHVSLTMEIFLGLIVIGFFSAFLYALVRRRMRAWVQADGLLAESNRTDQLERDLSQAIRHEQFELYYQPVLDVHSREVTGAEALIRWHHPVRGMVRPDEFIPLAEERGHIIRIGEWVIRQACEQIQRWSLEGMKPLPISINLSASQFQHKDILVQITEALHRNAVNPNLLILEVTERVTMDIDAAIARMDEIRQLGVRISMDDFGTGYSSLANLQKLPFDHLKIDRSFIGDMQVSNPSGQIVSAMIHLAHTLGMRVVAEGVESIEQYEMLKQLRCDQAQGFLFGKPMPAEQFAAYMRQGQLVVYI